MFWIVWGAPGPLRDISDSDQDSDLELVHFVQTSRELHKKVTNFDRFDNFNLILVFMAGNCVSGRQLLFGKTVQVIKKCVAWTDMVARLQFWKQVPGQSLQQQKQKRSFF